MRFPRLLFLLGVALVLAACRQVPPPEVGLALTATVGTVADACAVTPEITLITDAPETVYYCYTIENTGDVAIPVHDLADTLFGVILREFAFDLEPGESVDTVTAGITLERTVDATTTNTATWDGFVGDLRVASAEATTTVTIAAPPPPDPTALYGAAVGTFVADSNSPTIGAFSGNVILLSVLDLDEQPVTDPVDVDITVPGVGTFTYTFDPEETIGGVIALILADFEAGLGPTALRSLGVPVAYLPIAPAGTLGTTAAIGGDFVFAFPDETLVRTVDLDRILTVPVVSDVTLNAERDVMTVTFADDADPDVAYQLDAFGRGPAAVQGFADGNASPIDVELSGPLAIDEAFVVDVLAVSPSMLDLFEAAAQFDVAEYLYYSE